MKIGRLSEEIRRDDVPATFPTGSSTCLPEAVNRAMCASDILMKGTHYEFLWETGAAQSDAAQFCAEQIDWQRRILSYQRQKTGAWAYLQIGKPLEDLLRQLPSQGLLFPKWGKFSNGDRAAEFRRRCRILKIEGVSLHSYRYACAPFRRECLSHNFEWKKFGEKNRRKFCALFFVHSCQPKVCRKPPLSCMFRP